MIPFCNVQNTKQYHATHNNTRRWPEYLPAIPTKQITTKSTLTFNLLTTYHTHTAYTLSAWSGLVCLPCTRAHTLSHHASSHSFSPFLLSSIGLSSLPRASVFFEPIPVVGNLLALAFHPQHADLLTSYHLQPFPPLISSHPPPKLGIIEVAATPYPPITTTRSCTTPVPPERRGQL